MADPRTYLDDQGREMFVSDGLSRGRTWGTYRRKPSGSLERVVSKTLPLRPTQGKAQRDLDDRAGRKGWRAAGESETAKGERADVREPVYGIIGLTEVDVTKNIRSKTTASSELIASVRKRGLDKPVLVRLAPAGSAYIYEMMDGHRRHAAAAAVGLEAIPARIFDLTDREYREIQLECSGLHEDLDPLDRARALKRLIDEHGLTQAEAGALVEGGRTQGWVSKQLVLLDMPSEVHDFMRRGILSGSAAEELGRLKGSPEALGSFVKGLQEPDSALTVEQTRNAVNDTICREGRRLDASAHSDCKGCDRKTVAYNADYCLDPACWTAKREAHRENLRKTAIEGGMPLAPWDAAPAAMEACPDDCPESGMVLRQQGDDPQRACFALESSCYQARQAEHQARQNELRAAQQKQREAEDTIRQAEAEAREQAETERLARVQVYLAHRTASKQKTFSRPEARLLSLWVLSAWSGVEYAARVLGIDEDLEEVGPALAALSTRELTTIAVAHVLLSDLDDSAETGDSGLNVFRDEVVAQTETPEPADRGDILDAARLMRPPDLDDPDAAQEEEPATPGPSEPLTVLGGDGLTLLATGEDIAPLAPQAGTLLAAFAEEGTPELDRDCNRNCGRCDQKFCDLHPSREVRSHPEAEGDQVSAGILALAAASDKARDAAPADAEPEAPRVLDARFNPPRTTGPSMAELQVQVGKCPVDGIALNAWACAVDCARNKRDGGECCKSVLDGLALFKCDGSACPPDALALLDKSEATRARNERLATPAVPGTAHPELEDADAAVADAMAILSDASEDDDEPAEPEMAPLALEKASYGANPAVTVCPLSGQPRSATACLTCCRENRNRVVSSRKMGCCRNVTSGLAPFHCPGGLDQCPVAVDGEPEDEPAPAVITKCPIDGKPRTTEVCRTCCSGNKADEGCCAHVTKGEAPYRCDGVECPPEPEAAEALSVAAPLPGPEAPAPKPSAPAPEAPAAWTCPDYGEVVEPDFCRTCNAERPANGCCPHVLAGSAPFKCADCASPKDGCQAKGVA